MKLISNLDYLNFSVFIVRTLRFIILICLSFQQFSVASDTLSIYRKRKIGLGVSALVVTSGSIIYLNQAWYQKYNTSDFHLFNDINEWYQLDKFGHTYTNYQTARLMMEAMKWADYSEKKQVLVGGLSGFTYMTAVEMMDGFSDGWGFSWGDMAANLLGSGMAIGQHIAWKEQRIQLKFMYRSSGYAEYNTSLLGKNLSERILKDYNGQTYWLSINPSSFIKKDNKFPKWLNVAFGYGANGMLNAHYNKFLVIDANGNVINFDRYRQFYFSLDADLTRIKTKSKVLKAVFSCINVIKIPFPNLEFSENKFKFNPY